MEREGSLSKKSVEFSHDGHEYKVDGRVIPSVSQILQGVGIVRSYYSDDAAIKGITVHEILELIDNGLSSPEYFEEEYQGYISAWMQFKKDCKVRVIEIEKTVYHETLGYAGRIDRICLINGDRSIVDIKTGQHEKWHGVQMVAYDIALGPGKNKLVAVYLSDDGKYKMKSYKCNNFINTWYAALTLYQFKRKK